MLADLAKETTSEGRRELLRKVTEALDPPSRWKPTRSPSSTKFWPLIASDFSAQIRAQIARLVAGSLSPFSHTAHRFALDDIEVARPVLENSEALSEATLLKVVGQKSQDHMMAVTRRRRISEAVSQALVERGNDAVVTSLLTNQQGRDRRPRPTTWWRKRAETSPALQAPLVRRSGVPLELLNDLYMKVEADLRREIVSKFDSVPPEELEAAFQRTPRARLQQLSRQPEDFELPSAASTVWRARGALIPPVLVALMREGPSARTSFKIAFAPPDRCRLRPGRTRGRRGGSGHSGVAVPRRRISTGRCSSRWRWDWIASDRALAGAEEFGDLYESVPIQAAQRAIRFWKVRAA